MVHLIKSSFSTSLYLIAETMKEITRELSVNDSTLMMDSTMQDYFKPTQWQYMMHTEPLFCIYCVYTEQANDVFPYHLTLEGVEPEFTGLTMKNVIGFYLSVCFCRQSGNDLALI